MPVRLILNADDFGLTAGVNRAIAELHSANALTSATLMANGAAFEDALSVTRAHPALGVGCHVVLTDGVPVSAPASIPTLIAPGTATFRPKLGNFVTALLAGRIREDDIAMEARAQIRKLQDAGLCVTHVDTHKHTHLFPAVLRPLLRAARDCGVTAIRSPFEPPWADTLAHGAPVRRAAVRLSRFLRPRCAELVCRSGMQTTDGTAAISATGDLTTATLRELLRALPADGTYELCCHPGYDDTDLDRIATRLRTERNREREALLSVIPPLLGQANSPELIHYGAISPGATPASTPSASAW